MLAAMVLIGFPVAIGTAVVAHTGFHLPLDGRLAAAICFVASAVSTRVAAACRRTNDRIT